MRELNNWDIQFGSIRGEDETGKCIRTSRIVAREGDVVTTKTGSKYKLLECHKDAYIRQQEVRDLYWNGAKDEWECLDVQIETFNKRKDEDE